MKDTFMDQGLPQLPRTIYIPTISVKNATFKHSWNKLPVAIAEAPERACGEARRIGYTDRGENAFAIYRIKIKSFGDLPTVTLPHLYLLKNGLFVEYEQ